MPAEDGQATDGIGQIGVAEGDVTGDDEQDGVAS